MFEGLLQPTHLVLILAIILIVFGPGKLTGLGKAIGESMRELRKGASEITDATSSSVPTTTATATTLPTAARVATSERTVTEAGPTQH